MVLTMVFLCEGDFVLETQLFDHFGLLLGKQKIFIITIAFQHVPNIWQKISQLTGAESGLIWVI